MKKKYFSNALLWVFFTLMSVNVGFSQVGINTSTPRGILDVNTTNMGVVLPRVALTASNVAAPVTNPQTGSIPVGTTIYNTSTTTTGSNDITPGIYSWDGSKWIEQFQKRQHSLYQSSTGIFRTWPGVNYTIPLNGLNSPTFTAQYTGTYKLRVRVDFGGGDAIRPNEGSGSGTSDGDLNIARASGNFTFTFNGTAYTIPVYAFSTAYNNVTPATNYFAIWQEFFINEYVTLDANQTVSMSLTFLQDTAEEYVATGGGRGYVAYDLPCSVEISYMGE